jgi:Tfp pilus assembly protein PilF/O-antigen ligase
MVQQKSNLYKEVWLYRGLKTAEEITWLLMVLAVPLWVNLNGQQPFELPKVMLMRSLVWLLAALIIGEQILRGFADLRGRLKNPLLPALGLLALTLTITTATAVDWQLSLWGSYERSQGLLTHLSYLLLCLLAAYRLPSLARARRLIVLMILGTVPLLLLGLAQWFGWLSLGLVSDGRTAVYATLGRANFLGAYLAFTLPLTAGLLMTSDRKQRWLWGVILAGQLFLIGLTLARGAWLAAVFGLLLFGVLLWGGRLGRWAGLGWLGVGAVAVAGPLAVWWLGRLGAGSTAARLVIWQETALLTAQKPLLGYGAEALRIVFPAVYPPELVFFQGREYFVDRAHNWLLEWLIMAGWPGLLAFLLVIGVFVGVVGRALSRPARGEKRVFLAAILAAVLTNLVNNLVSFDVTPTATASWLLIGLGVALATSIADAPRVTNGQYIRWRGPLVGLCVLASVTASWQWNVQPLRADMAAREVQVAIDNGAWTEATASADRMINFWSAEPVYFLWQSQAYLGRAMSEPAEPDEATRWLAKAEEAVKQAQTKRPQDVSVWLETARVYRRMGQQFGLDMDAGADNAYRQAISLAPKQATIYAEWGEMLLSSGDASAAAALLRQAVQLDGSYGEAYLALGAAELALGRTEVALANYHEAVRLMPNSAQGYVGLAECYWQLQEPDATTAALAMALALDPENEQALHLLAEIEQGR